MGGKEALAQRAMTQLPLGSPVQYFSRSRGEWIPATVTGRRPGGDALELDVQRMATFKQVRPLPPGTAVLYFSKSQNGWLNAVIKGFDIEQAVYMLDIKAGANPAMVRLDTGSVPKDLSSATYTPTPA